MIYDDFAGIRRAVPRLMAVMLIALLGACSLGPQIKEQPAGYDLGPLKSYPRENPGIAAALLLPDISAPAWLDNQGIVYRLNYQDAAQPRIYANSRWAASPALLMSQRLRNRFAAATSGVVTSGNGARADYALRIDLEDFSQAFDAENQSRVSIRVRASLVNIAGRALIAQRTFTLERPAAPNAEGAVKALGAASDAMMDSLLEWTAQSLKGAKPG
jgi:cholesterol transport system auxiliary component